ncbi:MAG: DUF2892 domain-containing protein [Ignavibacteriae bacterium]|nr:DUF2892 domain-containing protein [Ignavibacteriota bacterium]
MLKNMGSADRIIRAIVAVVIGVLLLNGTIGGTVGIVLGVFAIIFLGTSALGSCPLYLPFKITTNKTPSAK